ncbi:MAG: adenylosuccinate synthase [Chloroflexi bacterium]|nr:adenylosuccinate synthase [Chloroflexota bacterium]
MPLDIIVGAQWGDEGKGRIVDLLSRHAAVVARFNGGDNAGHTVTVGSQTFKLHLIPSGIIHEHTTGVIGNGVVVNPETLLSEIEMLRSHGISVDERRLRLSHAAHLITPGHRALDQAQEKARGKGSIGTTGRGIGPAYTDKAARSGLRLEDILNEALFRDKLTAHIRSVNNRLTRLYDAQPLDVESTVETYTGYTRALSPYVTDTSLLIHEALQRGEHVLAEGAQGALLDLDYGTYPYVTSSAPTAPGALMGLGVGPAHIGRVIGVVKAFQTRVGAGPFPTEITDEIANRLRGTGSNPWDEYGTTTGRPRRVGWLDLVLLRYAARINGLNELVLTKLDVLSGLSSIKVCTAYRAGDKTFTDLPMGVANLDLYQPVYTEIAGWDEDLTKARKWDDLPAAAQQYIQHISDIVGVPVRSASVGPERDQVVSI